MIEGYSILGLKAKWEGNSYGEGNTSDELTKGYAVSVHFSFRQASTEACLSPHRVEPDDLVWLNSCLGEETLQDACADTLEGIVLATAPSYVVVSFSLTTKELENSGLFDEDKLALGVWRLDKGPSIRLYRRSSEAVHCATSSDFQVSDLFRICLESTAD